MSTLGTIAVVFGIVGGAVIIGWLEWLALTSRDKLYELQAKQRREHQRYLEIGGVVHDRTLPVRVVWKRHD